MPFFPKPRRRPAPADTDISTTDAAPRPFRPRPATGTQPADRPRFQREERNEFSSRDDRPRREDRPRDGRRPAGAFPRAGRPADRRDARPGSRSRNEAFQDPWVDGQPRFLPMNRAEMQALGWKELDVLLVNGDSVALTKYAEGQFRADCKLLPGENRIEARCGELRDSVALRVGTALKARDFEALRKTKGLRSKD